MKYLSIPFTFQVATLLRACFAARVLICTLRCSTARTPRRNLKCFGYKWILAGVVILLSGCATITGVGKDNTPKPSPLFHFTPQYSPHEIWSTAAGKGAGGKYVNLVPAINGNTLFTIDDKGHVTALNLQQGKVIWQVNLRVPLTGGVGAGEGKVLAGSQQADLYALDQTTGKTLWHIKLSSPMIAPAVIAESMAIIKTLDGRLWALDLGTGKTLWQQEQITPLMVLAGGSRPQVAQGKVITGYADGSLAAYSLKQGALIWKIAIAQGQGSSDIEQMTDIIGDPVVSGDTVYVITYQGNLAAVNINTGQILWQQSLSSYTGLALSQQIIFLTDAEGVVRAYNKQGQQIWQQDHLKYRRLTAPVVMGNAIVMGDGEGYLHWLSQADGSFIARATIHKDVPIVTAPLVNGDIVYALNAKGLLVADRLN